MADVAKRWGWLLIGTAFFAACAATEEVDDIDGIRALDGGADAKPKPDSGSPADAAKDTATQDSSPDVNVVDAASDSEPPPDAGADAKDSSVDAKDSAADAKDSAVDAKDSAADAPKDVTVDSAPDVVVVVDAAPDVTVDASPDVNVVDAAPDVVIVDAAPDVPVSDGGGLTCPSSACLLISEVYEGSGNDKALEIYNACSANVDLSSVDVCVEFNSSSYCKNGTGTGNTIALTGTLKPLETFVLCHASISSSSMCDKLDAKLSFNGNDRIALLRNNAIVDAFGELGKDPGDLWAEQDYRRTTCGAYLGTGAFSTANYVAQTSSSLSDLGKGP